VTIYNYAATDVTNKIFNIHVTQKCNSITQNFNFKNCMLWCNERMEKNLFFKATAKI
jgi:hypothetical protein